MNKILKLLVYSDLFIMSGFGLFQPVFAVFIISGIQGATVAAVGVAATVQLLTKAMFQILVAKWADSYNRNCRELYMLIAGSIIISIVPLGYAMSTTIAHLYLSQFFYGLGQALSYPSWRAIFAHYADGEHATYSWSVYDTITSLGVAASAALGGYLAETISFRWLFVVVSVLSIVGSLFLIRIFNEQFTCKIHFKKK